MDDSYVCSGAVMRCTFGTSTANLRVLPDRTVWLAGQRMANIMDHKSMANIPGFGRCRTVTYPATGAATAAHHGHLTPMPCIPGTLTPWMPGKPDYLIQGPPALLKSCKCMCQWGGVITIDDDGQHGEGTQYVNKEPHKTISTDNAKFETTQKLASNESLPSTKPSLEDLNNFSSLNDQEKILILAMSNKDYARLVNKVKQQRMNTAIRFYEKRGVDPMDIPSHLNGIDFSKPVSVVDIPPPETMYQYTYGSDASLGEYFSDDKNTKPDALGVNNVFREVVGHDEHGRCIYSRQKIAEKHHQKIDVSNDVPMKALKSTAATIVDDWSDPLNPKRTSGGGTQYYINKKQQKGLTKSV